MVSTVDEADYFTALAREYGIRTAGVMVEVPSSALLAEHIFAHADFASIGTNDLTQYTLAADRLLGSVAGFQDPWHPAVLRLIREVGAAGARTGCYRRVENAVAAATAEEDQSEQRPQGSPHNRESCRLHLRWLCCGEPRTDGQRECRRAAG